MKHFTYLLTFIIISTIACTGINKQIQHESNPPKEILRLDKDLYNYIQAPSSIKEDSLIKKYPELIPALETIISSDNSEAPFKTMKEYFSHPMLMKIYSDAIDTFDNVSIYEEQLGRAEGLAIQHLRNRRLPQFAMHISGFKENVIVLDNLISISIDKYLGKDYTGYNDFFRQYERQQMQPIYVTRDYLRAWLMSDIVKIDNKDLLSTIITEGKILYAISQLLPDMNDEDIIGYTKEQYQWCEQNKKDIWKKIINQEHLYSEDPLLISYYLNNAPSSSSISPESPGRASAWIGWQIVKEYAKKQNSSLQEIIEANPLTLFKDSKFNP